MDLVRFDGELWMGRLASFKNLRELTLYDYRYCGWGKRGNQVIEDCPLEIHHLCDPKEISKGNPQYDEPRDTRITEYGRAACKITD